MPDFAVNLLTFFIVTAMLANWAGLDVLQAERHDVGSFTIGLLTELE